MIGKLYPIIEERRIFPREFVTKWLYYQGKCFFV